MTRRRPTRLALALGGALLCVLLCGTSARAEEAPETCEKCHAEQRDVRLRKAVDQLPTSIHGRAKLTCTSCHGGRGDEPSIKAHDTGAGFRARAAASGSPDVCGNCHSDAAAMAKRDAKLPTDQLGLYVDSVHGRARERGNDKAATCSSCHGSHDIKAAHDAKSPVHPKNVASTCGGCHSSEERMRSLGMPYDQERQWRRSVHGRKHAAWTSALGDAAPAPGVRHPPSCNDCHDDHGNVGREAAVKGCERCHAEEWESFQRGPHALAFRRMGFLPCVDCHGSHEIVEAYSTLIGVDSEAACRRCHAEGQKVWDTIGELARVVRNAEQAAVRARTAAQSLPVGKLASTLAPIDAAQHALRQAIHTLDASSIGGAAQQLSTHANAVQAPAPGVAAVLKEHRGSWLTVGLMVLGLVALLLAHRRGSP